jgi:prefoldin subunit 5
MAEGKVKIIFEAVDKASQTAQNLRDKIAGLSKTTAEATTTTSRFNQIISDVKGFIGATAGVTALVMALRKSVGAWAEEEQSITKMRNALSLAYDDVEKATEYFEALAQELQNTMGITDTAGREMIALAVRMGTPTDKIKELVTTSINMSRALGIDSTTAMQLLIRASNGATAGLSRLGIRLDENRVKSEGMTYVLAALGEKFKGMGEAYMETTQGAMTNFRNAMEDLTELVGKAVVEGTGFKTILAYLTTLLRQAQSETSGLGTAIRGLGWVLGAVGKLAVTLIDVVFTGLKQVGLLLAGIGVAVTGHFKEAGRVIKETIKDLKAGFEGLIDRVIALYTNQDKALKNMVQGTKAAKGGFNEVNKLVGDLNGNLENSNASIQALIRQLKGFKAALPGIKRELQETFDVSDVLGDLEDRISAGLDILREKLEIVRMRFETARGVVYDFARRVSDAFMDAIAGSRNLGQALADLLKEMAVYIVKATIMAAITKAIFSLTGLGAGLSPAQSSFGGLFLNFLGGLKEGGVVQGIRPIATLQEGGVITRPTLALVGEGGEPEYIIPQSKLGLLQPQIQVVIHNATPETYVEIFTRMGQKEKKIIKRELLNA